MEMLETKEKEDYLRAWEEEKPTIDNVVEFGNKWNDVVTWLTITNIDNIDPTDLLALCTACTLMLRQDEKWRDEGLTRDREREEWRAAQEAQAALLAANTPPVKKTDPPKLPKPIIELLDPIEPNESGAVPEYYRLN